ncbi:AAA family ATPase [Paenibacillus sanguinis]|uniref:AAA family ATPase n=1 Tax=Paenibacillus sanguinis TaxID=225906 RepID=UPI0003676558|nr:AAA family ATPase [Paenibacillus sanguinis]
MKPIALKLAGLQSYRELQTIDFMELCETGLFGIFGPTGSGKSTILDALTLALYGKVGRASGGTQGIMNHAEDSLFVAFTFELASAAEVECYRVERRFKRQSELTVSNTISRFIEILPEGEKVLADKLADVTRCVEQKIGLKMDDFTRAVVLPQGKFAEFLSLRGAERRAMLQRLFHLEKYGDLLAQKLSRRVKETEQRRAEAAAEQQGLGHASAEALEQAADALREAATQAAQRRRALLEAQQRHDQLARVRELSVERGQRVEQLAALRAQDGAVAALEAKLARGAAAEAIRPVLTAWEDARRGAAERERQAAEAQEAAQACAARARQAESAARAALQALEHSEPELLVKLEQLEQARGLQAEAEALAAEVRQLAGRREEGMRQRLALKEQTAKEEELLSKAQGLQRTLEQQLQGAVVKSEERERRQAAVQHAQRLAGLQEQSAKAAAEETRSRTKLQEAADRLALVSRDMQQAAEATEALKGQVAVAEQQLGRLEGLLSARLQEWTTHEAALRQALKAQERRLWSSRLAGELAEGEPCPVCGSAHHPVLAGQAEGAHQIGESQLEEWTELTSACRDLLMAVSRDRANCRTWFDSLGIEPGEEDGRERRQVPSTAEDEVAAALVGPSLEQDELSATRLRQHVQEYADQHEAVRHHLAALQLEVRRTSSTLAALQLERATAEAAVSAASELVEQTALRSAGFESALVQGRQEWEDLFPGIKPEEASRHLEEISANDRLAEELRQRLEASIPYLEDKAAKLLALAQESIELDKQLVQWEAQEQGKQELLREKQERLHVWAGERPVEAQLGEARERLAGLRRQVETTRQQQAAAVAESHERAKVEALALQAALTAKEQAEQLELRWLGELEASPFEVKEDVLESQLAPGEGERLAEKVQYHRRREQELELSINELDAKLQGQTLGSEEWQASVDGLAAAKQLDEAALQLHARTERDWEELQVRHTRWQELEQRRSELERESGLLGKLQTSLRGNAFVEYVAEEQLMNVSHAASQRLRSLTKQRYALETDSGGGFVIRDDANGGAKRPVATLSGGETFLTSLALALALSAQIQLRGQYPLQFFFLDEGFGTLDPELLDTVITSLEHLHHDHLSVGIISHVAELRTRLARKLVVIPADSGGAGSRIETERL